MSYVIQLRRLMQGFLEEIQSRCELNLITKKLLLLNVFQKAGQTTTHLGKNEIKTGTEISSSTRLPLILKSFIRIFSRCFNN
jgi:hypothetical protein